MLIYPIEPKIYSEPYLPEEQLLLPLEGSEMRWFIDTITTQAQKHAYTPSIQKLLETYTRALIETYMNLPEREVLPEAYAKYHIMVRTATLDAVTQIFSFDVSQETMEKYAWQLVTHYIDRFHDEALVIPEHKKRDVLGSKMKDLFKAHYLHKPWVVDTYIDHALYSYIPTDKNDHEQLFEALKAMLHLLYTMSKQQVQNQIIGFGSIPYSLKQDVQMRNGTNFTTLLHALHAKKSPAEIASLVLASNRLASHQEIENMQPYLMREATALRNSKDFMGILLYIFHYQMQHDLNEIVSWYGKRLLSQKKYHV